MSGTFRPKKKGMHAFTQIIPKILAIEKVNWAIFQN